MVTYILVQVYGNNNNCVLCLSVLLWYASSVLCAHLKCMRNYSGLLCSEMILVQRCICMQKASSEMRKNSESVPQKLFLCPLPLPGVHIPVHSWFWVVLLISVWCCLKECLFGHGGPGVSLKQNKRTCQCVLAEYGACPVLAEYGACPTALRFVITKYVASVCVGALGERGGGGGAHWLNNHCVA